MLSQFTPKSIDSGHRTKCRQGDEREDDVVDDLATHLKGGTHRMMVPGALEENS
jgi:hypothetical protein